MTDYKNTFTEVYTILNLLDEEEYNKIPPEVIKVIEQNRNVDYYYELDEDVELKNQKMLPETKAVLFNLFRDYLSTSEQKEKIIKMQKDERKKNELKKQDLYDTNIFNNKKDQEEKYKEECIKEGSIIKYKENIIEKLLNNIKRFLHRNKNYK